MVPSRVEEANTRVEQHVLSGSILLLQLGKNNTDDR